MLPTSCSTFLETANGWGCARCRWRDGSGLTLAEYRDLEAGEMHITFDLYHRIVELCGWPRG